MFTVKATFKFIYEKWCLDSQLYTLQDFHSLLGKRMPVLLHALISDWYRNPLKIQSCCFQHVQCRLCDLRSNAISTNYSNLNCHICLLLLIPSFCFPGVTPLFLSVSIIRRIDMIVKWHYIILNHSNFE